MYNRFARSVFPIKNKVSMINRNYADGSFPLPLPDSIHLRSFFSKADFYAPRHRFPQLFLSRCYGSFCRIEASLQSGKTKQIPFRKQKIPHCSYANLFSKSVPYRIKSLLPCKRPPRCRYADLLSKSVLFRVAISNKKKF